MADTYQSGPSERDIEQAVTALKKGSTLLKYGRIGKPKFCPFRLSNDESMLIWYSGKEEKQLKLSQVSRIVPGQRTVIFQRFPRPDKEYQSFSLLYGDSSLDVICKDKDEAEIWFVALTALISGGGWRKGRNEARESSSSSANGSHAQKLHHSPSTLDAGDFPHQFPHDISPPRRLGKAFSDMMLYTATSENYNQVESSASPFSLPSTSGIDIPTQRSSTSDNFRASLSSVVSSSSQGSCPDDFDSLGDVFIWGEGAGEGFLGGGTVRVSDSLISSKFDAILPKTLESTVVLDVHYIACGARHAALITKQGDIFSWGEESGGRLGHGVEVDVSHPKLIDAFRGMNIEQVACGEHHSCAITTSGDLFTWGDGTYNSGILGHGSLTSHWTPKRVCGPLDGKHVSYVSCGPWHTAALLSTGQLFTFGDGTFGALGHGDRTSSSYPREVETLRGLRTLRVACGAWHTAAIVDVMVNEAATAASFEKTFIATGKLFTWGVGSKGQLGHDKKEAWLVPQRVAALVDVDLCKVACGYELTVALTASGRVYTMGSPSYGQLGCRETNERTPVVCVEGNIVDSFIEDIACGSHHVAALTSRGELFTWGKGTNGQLGHGDNSHRNEPTYVTFMKDKQVRSVACGSNFTAAVCPHKWVGTDHSACTSCHNLFGFRRKRHNCYNCGQVFCKTCSSQKSLKAALAPNTDKPYRVCDDCFAKLKKAVESGTVRVPRLGSKNAVQKSNEGAEKETMPPKLSSFSFASSMIRTDSGFFKDTVKLRRFGSAVAPISNENFQPGSGNQSSAPTPLSGPSNKHVSASAPEFRMIPRAVSLGSQWCGPDKASIPIASLSAPTCTQVPSTSSKHTDDDLRQEVILLRGEVEKLTRRNQLLEAELEKTRKELTEAKEIAADETAKSKAAKEVIKSLTAQLKEITERAEDTNKAICKSDSQSGQSSGGIKNESHGDQLTSLPTSETNMGSMDATVNKGVNNTQTDKTEYVVQEEPGVYITLRSLPDGGNELRRMRFSRKRFSQEQAQKWWAENSNRVHQRHNIQRL